MMFRLVLLSACVAFCGACTCYRRAFPDALCEQSILFRGAAIAEGTEVRYRYNPHVFTVRVDQAFRMPASLRNNQTITIDPSSSTSCSTGFTLNEDTLFAAYMLQSGEVETCMCCPNTRWNDLSAWYQQLLESNELYCANLESLLDATAPPRHRHAALGFVTWFFSTVLGWERT
ncbi:uncharacterized protein [Littorina saxatilis]|uniref:uncharacterized protein n=1 Tax=Littorina saxatilis TaxID=31220 RepID=UPI0038B66817